MSEFKKIDSFFQDKFVDFEVNPPEMVWDKIKIELEEKKKQKRVIPFWWKLAGVAAVFVIGTSVVLLNFNDATTPKMDSKNDVVSTQKNSNSNKKDSNSSALKSVILKPRSSIVVIENKPTEKYVFESFYINKTITNKNSLPTNNSYLNENTSNSNENSLKNTFASSSKNTKFAKNTRFKKHKTLYINSPKNNDVNIENEKTIVVTQLLPITNLKSEYINQNQTEISVPNKTQGMDFVQTESNKLLQNGDSLKTALQIKNPLDELLKQKETQQLKQVSIEEKWQVKPNVAPLFFGAVSGGSPIDNSFASNSKQYITSLSYGVGFSYKLTKKIAIQSGISKLTLDYNTNDIVFYADLGTASLQNINTNSAASKIRVVNRNALVVESQLSESNIGFINQKIGYVEIPVELTYKIIDSKFGLNLIGGFSTLLLNENVVSVSSPTYTIVLGEANNLNKIHYSSNIGLGFKYSIFKSVNLTFDPVFKYQLNTFSTNSGNFKPYFFGCYTGFSYRF